MLDQAPSVIKGKLRALPRYPLDVFARMVDSRWYTIWQGEVNLMCASETQTSGYKTLQEIMLDQ